MDEDYEIQRIIDAHPACTTAKNGTGSRCTCVESCANYWLRAKGFKDLESQDEASHYGDGHRASLFYEGAPGMLSESDRPVTKARVRDLQPLIVLSGMGWVTLAIICGLLVLVFGPAMLYAVLVCVALGALCFIGALINSFIN